MGILVSIIMLVLLVSIVRATTVPGRDDSIMRLMVGSYLLRMFIQIFSRDFAFFSHGGGGDSQLYEAWAVQITRIWQFSGLEYITADELPELGATTLPSNLFAIVIAINGGEATTFGCTALIACMACLSCLNLYHLSIELGGDPKRALTITTLLLFSPAYLLYTSDMYKDGLVIFAASMAISSAIRLARQFSFVHLVLGGIALWALWYIRFYLVFVCSAPLLVGLTGVRSKSSVRPLLVSLLMSAAFVGLVSTTEVFGTVSDKATATFQHGTSQVVRESNAVSGSGVTFDDGGDPLAALGPKLAYQLFSPFPWAGGSVGFHIGKIDTFLWYYLMYRAYLAGKALWREDRTTLLMLLSFILPTTFMYATSFANVGLSLRQRLIIVMITAVLAARSWPAEQPAAAKASGDPPPAPGGARALPSPWTSPTA